MTQQKQQFADTPEEWRVNGERTSFAGRIWDIRSEEVVMPDGAVAVRDYMAHPGAVGVLALDEQRRALLVRQYRHPVRHRLWELPAGLLDVPGRTRCTPRSASCTRRPTPRPRTGGC